MDVWNPEQRSLCLVTVSFTQQDCISLFASRLIIYLSCHCQCPIFCLCVHRVLAYRVRLIAVILHDVDMVLIHLHSFFFAVLNRHRAGVNIGGPSVPRDEQELLGIRCHGAEVPTFLRDLLRKAGPILASSLRPSVLSSVLPNVTATNVTRSILPASVPTRTKSSYSSREIDELGTIIDGIANSRSHLRNMPETPEQTALPSATYEVEMLKDLCSSLTLMAVKPPPSKKEVLKCLSTCKIFHFAGHG